MNRCEGLINRCEDCDHYGITHSSWPTNYLGCKHPKAKKGEPDPVDGHQKYYSPATMRSYDCGREGSLFEKRPPDRAFGIFSLTLLVIAGLILFGAAFSN